MGKKLTDYRILVAPGLHGSGEGHWQTRWEALYPWFERIEQWHWDRPDLDAWSTQVANALRRSARPAIVVAHSFGCLATVRAAANGAPNLAAVLLVAPADPRKFGVEDDLLDARLTVPARVVGSENDPWMPVARARVWAERWEAGFINAGRLGHINAESDLGDWAFGLTQLYRLVQGLPSTVSCRCGGVPAPQSHAWRDALRGSR